MDNKLRLCLFPKKLKSKNEHQTLKDNNKITKRGIITVINVTRMLLKSGVYAT